MACYRYGMTWHGRCMVWHSIVGYGMAWHKRGMVWHDRGNGMVGE